jgi:hypothetical protein
MGIVEFFHLNVNRIYTSVINNCSQVGLIRPQIDTSEKRKSLVLPTGVGVGSLVPFYEY